MKKMLIGMSSLFLGQSVYSSTVYRNFINVSEPETQTRIEKKEADILKINKKNLLKANIFFNSLKKDNIFENILNYKLLKTKVEKIDNRYYITYEAEDKYKKVTLTFPIKYNNGKILDIYPVYYDTQKKEMISYKINFEIKDIKREFFEKLFLSQKPIILNKGKTDINYYIVAESENKVTYEKISNYFNSNGEIKNKYKDLNIYLILIPTNYYSEKFSMEISALLSQLDDGNKATKLFIEYLKNRESIMNSIKDKYFKKFRDGYAGDFILDMYQETNESLNTISREFVTELLSNIKKNGKKDIISTLKKEQQYVDNIIKLDILNGDYLIFKEYPNSRYFYTYKGKLK